MKRIITIILAVLVLVALVGCGSKTANSSSTTAAIDTTATVVATDPPTTNDNAAWAAAALPVLKSLGADFTQMSTDATNEDLSATLSDCYTIQRDVAVAQALPPAPPTVSGPLASAIADYGQGASACITGINTTDVSLIQQATSSFSDGTTQINLASAALTTLNGG